ncbi:hypothetical protein BOX15_Mlig001018g1, partial [Macrostomum lignano]
FVLAKKLYCFQTISKQLINQASGLSLSAGKLIDSSVNMSTRAQPLWQPPQQTPGVDNLPPLKLFNSLTNQKEPFVPEKGRHVEWYSCGPTVYDMSHMGHARSYISFDIMRRIFVDYFKFDVHYVMNITDIDDKIIKRARQGYLFDQYSSRASSLDEVRADVLEAVKRLESKASNETDPDKQAMHKRDLDKVQAALNSDNFKVLLTQSRDCLCDWLDSKLGSTVTDNAVFEDLPKQFEREYFVDMRALNILDPDRLVRVSEVVPEIIDYCQKIIDQGFAYESNGSVYFDTQKFSEADGHFYAKLVPAAYGNQKLLQEGEGDLSIGADRLREKRSQADFALWKASKPGEPAWKSPWGSGRPGWHIECSVMASKECGPVLDIHTGGVDLKFPHHDNELAQAEAYFGHSHWVRYFLHSGHLTISGCKMSKSLKNFITIREALAQHSPRKLRLAFLLHSWKDTLDYSEETMTLAASYERQFADFFYNIARAVEELQLSSESDSSVAEDFAGQVASFDDKIREALCDNLDTRRSLIICQEAIFAANNLLASSNGRTGGNVQLLQRLAVAVTRLLDVYGTVDVAGTEPGFKHKPLPDGFYGLEWRPATKELIRDLLQEAKQFFTDCNPDLAPELASLPNQLIEALQKSGIKAKFGDDKPEVDDLPIEAASIDRQVTLAPLLRAIADARASVRLQARERKLKDVLAACDVMRDDRLSRLGVRLQDREGNLPAAVGFYPADLLAAERSERAEREANKAAEKAAKAAAKASLEDRGKQPAEQMFLGDTDKYSKFDERGMPTHDAQGKEVSKSALKKLQKLWDAQAKRHADWLKSNK